MPLYKRTSPSATIGNITGFIAIGCNPSNSITGGFIFSNSPSNTGSNEFIFLICESNTIGNIEGSGSAFLPINLSNNYLQQSWSIKNTTIGVGEHVLDETHEEYFESEVNSFVFSEGDGNFLIKGSGIEIKSASQQEFNIKLNTTTSGVQYEFIDSPYTKMKWTSKIEILQNLSKNLSTQFNFSQVESQILNGSMPNETIFSLGSNESVILDAGIDENIPSSNNVVDGGSV